MAKFFDKIEYYIEMPMLAAFAKRNLNTIIIKLTKKVNKYYHKLYKL